VRKWRIVEALNYRTGSGSDRVVSETLNDVDDKIF